MLEIAVRIFLVERNDLIHVGARSILQTSGSEHMLVSIRNYEDLELVMRVKAQMHEAYQDVLLLGKCPSDMHGDLIALLDDLIPLCKMPIVLMGGVAHGWFIHFLLKKSSIRGYIHKRDNLENILLPAIQTILSGKPYVSFSAEQIIKDAKLAGLMNCTFGDEEIQIIRLLALGYSHKEVAAQLGVEPRRIYTVTERLRHLFGVGTTEAMMVEARSCGLC